MFTKEVRSIDPDPKACGPHLLRDPILTLKEQTPFTNVTKLEKFVDQEVCVSSEFEKPIFRQSENLRGPQIRLFKRQIHLKIVLLECGVRGIMTLFRTRKGIPPKLPKVFETQGVRTKVFQNQRYSGTKGIRKRKGNFCQTRASHMCNSCVLGRLASYKTIHH